MDQHRKKVFERWACESECIMESIKEQLTNDPTKKTKKVSCICCGAKKIDDAYSACETCGWVDDPIQNVCPDHDIGANELSLNDYRKKFQKIRKEDPDYIWADNPEKMREK